ncbi:MAG: hypothetical protein ACLP0A_13755 [Verrucomicrobiia bacterium]
MREIFEGIGLCPKKLSDYRLFKVIERVAQNANVTPYCADKVFWLIGSGKFYLHESQVRNEGKVKSHKSQFIASARRQLVDP